MNLFVFQHYRLECMADPCEYNVYTVHTKEDNCCLLYTSDAADE